MTFWIKSKQKILQRISKCGRTIQIGRNTLQKPILKTAALFSCLTSLRISDILSLQWHEIVDFAAGGKCVHTITQKTKTEDIIPISDEALQLIGYSPEKPD